MLASVEWARPNGLCSGKKLVMYLTKFPIIIYIVNTVFTRNDTMASINFTAVEGGDNSSYAGSEARKVFINTSSDISGVNK